MIRIYNSMTRTKEEFIPLNPPKVSMYVCGPTVYDLLHVGNFRGPVIYNLMCNWLERSGYQVSMALNFTDVDDKIIKRANEKNVSSEELSQTYIQEYKNDFRSLGLRPHDLNPTVSGSMDAITDLIEDLIIKGKAYRVDNDVLYSVDSFSAYGKLSGRTTEEAEAGSRIEIDKRKKNTADFALWKSAKSGEPAWPSPWGPGRPGWHIECSAMICKHFGEQIDIHGGGMDLLFPHHENEIAQSEGASGKQFVKYWIHTNMLNFSGQKMSKSVGNIVSLRSFVSEYNAEIYKTLILTTHYRSLNEFGEEAIQRAIGTLGKFYSSLAIAESILNEAKKNGLGDHAELVVKKTEGKLDKVWTEKTAQLWQSVSDALNDDFNTPVVFASLFDFLHLFNSQMKRGMKVNEVVAGKAFLFFHFIREVGSLMALFQESPSHFLNSLDEMLLKKMNLKREAIDQLVSERSRARLEKNFAKSDELRKQLTDLGISVSDTAEGSFWEVAK